MSSNICLLVYLLSLTLGSLREASLYPLFIEMIQNSCHSFIRGIRI
jgi:hypothetical protein